MRKIKQIVVHCSATPNGEYFDANDIRQWHTSPDPNDPTKPWNDIGYHYVITTTGTIQTGRPIEKMGAHVRGHNRNSIGICLIGTSEYSEEQWQSLDFLLEELLGEYPGAELFGHCDLDPERRPHCPGFDVKGHWDCVMLERSLQEEPEDEVHWFIKFVNLIIKLFKKGD